MKKYFLAVVSILLLTKGVYSQTQTVLEGSYLYEEKTGQKNAFDLTINLSVAKEVEKSFRPDGRLFVFLNKNSKAEPRTETGPDEGNYIFARNMTNLNALGVFQIKDSEGWSKTPDWTLGTIPAGEYYLQILWDADTEESDINAPGNIYSEKQAIVLNKSITLNVSLNSIIPKPEIMEHKLVRVVDIQSDTLTRWWGKPMRLKASVLLPSKYGQNPRQAYAIRYNVAGFGGRYTRINNRILKNKEFMDWWQSDSAPQIINVFLDGEGPLGDSYQMDSENSGPYGYSLIHELIPYIEKNFRGTNTAETRFTDGCSTGGWVSLALQLYYPDFFNGAFSYSPDPVDFEFYQLTNIYKDKNAFINKYGYLRPVMRTVYGDPVYSVKDFIKFENVLGSSNSYLNSGDQFGAHTALYSPKGNNGLPKPLFDPVTGEIDSSVAKHWEKYDLKKYVEKNWSTLGSKIQGKIFIWMGDMDSYYLNPATRSFDAFLKSTKNPVSDAEVVFTPMKGHCAQFSQKNVLMQMQERIEKLNGNKTPADKK